VFEWRKNKSNYERMSCVCIDWIKVISYWTGVGKSLSTVDKRLDKSIERLKILLVKVIAALTIIGVRRCFDHKTLNFWPCHIFESCK
jgi:hypothetical protein